MTARLPTKLRSSATPRLEWLLGTFGLALLVSGVFFLVYRALTHPDEPGAVVATVTDVHDVGNTYVVRFNVRNYGSETLSHLHLTARLTDGNVQIESAPAFVDYLPAHSEQEGGVYLRNDPRGFTLQIDPAGYTKP